MFVLPSLLHLFGGNHLNEGMILVWMHIFWLEEEFSVERVGDIRHVAIGVKHVELVFVLNEIHNSHHLSICLWLVRHVDASAECLVLAWAFKDPLEVAVSKHASEIFVNNLRQLAAESLDESAAVRPVSSVCSDRKLEERVDVDGAICLVKLEGAEFLPDAINLLTILVVALE